MYVMVCDEMLFCIFVRKSAHSSIGTIQLHLHTCVRWLARLVHEVSLQQGLKGGALLQCLYRLYMKYAGDEQVWC